MPPAQASGRPSWPDAIASWISSSLFWNASPAVAQNGHWC
jgi:hypothetical protein